MTYYFTGLERTYLETLREREGDTEAAPDLAADLIEATGEVKFRPARWTDQVAQILARSVTEDMDDAA